MSEGGFGVRGRRVDYLEVAEISSVAIGFWETVFGGYWQKKKKSRSIVKPPQSVGKD